jgi:hypothetical protein
VHGTQSIPLHGGPTRYRYYLVWITKLPAGQELVSVNELALYE